MFETWCKLTAMFGKLQQMPHLNRTEITVKDRTHVARNSCKSKIEFYFCDVGRNKVHRVKLPNNLVARNFAR